MVLDIFYYYSNYYVINNNIQYFKLVTLNKTLKKKESYMYFVTQSVQF
jgi:hypothetical protein